MTKLYIFYTFFFIIRFCKYSVIQTRDAEEIPLRIQFQVFFLYLFDQRNGNILFEVVSWSVMQKVLAQFVDDAVWFLCLVLKSVSVSRMYVSEVVLLFRVMVAWETTEDWRQLPLSEQLFFCRQLHVLLVLVPSLLSFV